MQILKKAVLGLKCDICTSMLVVVIDEKPSNEMRECICRNL